MSNAVAAALLVPPIALRLGPGCAAALVLLAGAGANMLGPARVSVGASTATFGAIGILAGLRLRLATGVTAKRSWLVLVAAVLLLAMLGTGPNADVVGHALGLAMGAVLGLATGVSSRLLATPMQLALLGVVALVVVGCWLVALAGVG